MNYVPANNWWVGSEQYNLLWGNGGHPGNTADAVRQWRAPQAGTIHITGSASDANVACGNGVIVSIKKGATVLWQQTINNGNTGGFSYDLTVNVTAGDQINFVINARGENICDSTNFDPAISYVRTYQASADFGSAQGQKNWYYQNGAGSPMNYVSANNWWIGSEQYNLLWGSGGHPGNTADAVRQWRAPQAGTIRITGSAADGNYACGDGVIVSIQKGAEVLWQQTILNGNTSGFAYDITVAVAAGEQINFVINKRANYDCDSTNFDPTIVYTSGAIVHWLVTDQLGTPRIILDQSGALANVSRHDYLPFGEEIGAGVGGRTTTQGYTASDNVRQKFTSKERDAETGLDYFGARYYTTSQGRFTSSDPFSFQKEMLTDPQRFNLYAYVRNNPLFFIDPTGMIIDTSGLSSDDLKKWEKILEVINAKDKDGNYINAKLHEAYERLNNDKDHTFLIENYSFGERSGKVGQTVITKHNGIDDFSQAVIRLDFEKVEHLEGTTDSDVIKGFKKFEGLIGGPAEVLRAELFGHEGGGHGVWSLDHPAEAVQMQILVDSRDAAMKGTKYPYPADVVKKIEAADKALGPTELYAQQTEQIINKELQAYLKAKNK